MKKMELSTLLRISLLGAISFVLMQFDFSIGFAPAFYKMDISDLPPLIGAFAMGPLAGILIELVKNALHVFQSSTGGIGEIANFISGGLFVGVAGFIYQRNKTRKNAIIGMAIGTLIMSVVGSILNYYVLIPVFSKVYGLPVKDIVAMAQGVYNGVFVPVGLKLGMSDTIRDVIMTKKTLVMYMVFPFNIVKGLLVSVITIPLYKRLSAILIK